MSFFDDASLVFLPSGQAGKDGKAYSMKPTNGDGDFTFSRGSNLTATRVDSNGLIEKGRENLFKQSNNFNTTPWTTSDTSVTSEQSGYDGSNDAWLLNSTATGAPRIQQLVSLSGVATYSVYAKAATDSFIQLRTFGADSEAWFNLSSGTIAAAYGSQYVTSNIQSVGNGWYKCSMTFNGSLTTLRIYPASAFAVYSTSGNGVYIQDAQLEQGLVATEYIESGATTGLAGILEDSPRFDYSGGASCPSLLLEPSRTNLVGQSEYYGSNLLVNATIDTNNATSPEGLQNATLLTEETNTGNHAIREASNILIAADDSQYVVSFYAKSNGRNIRFIDDGYAGSNTIVNFNLSSGGTFSNGSSVIDSDAVAFGNGWYYCYAVIDKASAAQSAFRFSLRLLGGASNDNDSYTGDGSRGAWLYGKQVEDSVTYPTSYIPNHSGGSVTREADVCTNSTGGVSQTEGTIFIDYKDSPNKDVLFACSTSSGLITNNIRLSYNQLYIRNSTGNLVVASVTLPDEGKLAIKYDTNGVEIFSNGSSIYTNSTRISFDGSVDFVRVGSRVNNAGIEEFNVNQFLIFTTALSDNNCITLTS